MDYSNQFFATHDLGLASALVTAGFPLDHLDRTNPQKVKFVFGRIDGQDEVIQSYWGNLLRLSVLEFFNTVKMLKNRIYSEQLGGDGNESTSGSGFYQTKQHRMANKGKKDAEVAAET